MTLTKIYFAKYLVSDGIIIFVHFKYKITNKQNYK